MCNFERIWSTLCYMSGIPRFKTILSRLVLNATLTLGCDACVFSKVVSVNKNNSAPYFCKSNFPIDFRFEKQIKGLKIFEFDWGFKIV